MGRIFESIERLVATERYVVGQHAVERLEQRGILEWQVVTSLDEGRLIVERLNAKPNAVAEVRQTLPDGTDIKAVWSYLPQSNAAKLGTVHFLD